MEDNPSVDVLEQARKRAEMQAEMQRKKVAQSVANKAKAAADFALNQVDNVRPSQPNILPKAQNWNCRIELFRMQDDKPLAYNLLVETAGADLADAVELVVKRLRS